MNKLHLFIAAGIFIVVVGISFLVWKKQYGVTIGNADYPSRLIQWGKQYNTVPLDDLEMIEKATTITQMVKAVQEVPKCRGAKIIAHLYFSIYVERDEKALKEFVQAMKKYFGDDTFQWKNALFWPQGNQAVMKAFEEVQERENARRKETESESEASESESEDDTGKIKNFKANVQDSKAKNKKGKKHLKYE